MKHNNGYKPTANMLELDAFIRSGLDIMPIPKNKYYSLKATIRRQRHGAIDTVMINGETFLIWKV